jgi:hypothetical protein
MGTLIALTAIVVTAFFCLFAVLAFVGFAVKAAFWLLFFPIRLLFKMIFGLLGAGLALLFAPLMLLFIGIVVIGVILTALVSLLAPLLPVALVALVGWAIYRGSTRRPSPVI